MTPTTTRSRITRTIFAAGAAAVIAMPGLAGAQDGTDIGGELLPVTPTADQCIVETPRTVEEIQAIIDAGPQIATPETSLITEGDPVTNIPSSAAPADEPTVAAITATLIAWYGCVNAGDLLAAAALETDGLIAQQIATGLSLSNVELAEGENLIDILSAAPVPLEGDNQFTINEVRDVVVLRTGDVRAQVRHTVPGTSQVATDTISFARTEDGSFLIAGAVLGKPQNERPARN
ncbi:MAG TPA: hypothetical protein VGT61_10330 [Thermomicrobiales bacterium]|jgi:hypothetical protein|nr:hypothetical protein [Thermomicrobiales bacterium]